MAGRVRPSPGFRWVVKRRHSGRSRRPPPPVNLLPLRRSTPLNVTTQTGWTCGKAHAHELLFPRPSHRPEQPVRSWEGGGEGARVQMLQRSASGHPQMTGGEGGKGGGGGGAGHLRLPDIHQKKKKKEIMGSKIRRFEGDIGAGCQWSGAQKRSVCGGWGGRGRGGVI